MRSRILHHLEAILKTGSIAEASRQYFIAQPSLSQFVKRLEEEHRIRYSTDAVTLGANAGRPVLSGNRKEN